MCCMTYIMYSPFRETKAHSAVQKISDYKAREKAKVEVSCLLVELYYTRLV